MTPEEKAKNLYPTDDPRKNMHHDNMGQYSRQNAFIEGANWMAEEKDKEIAALREENEWLKRKKETITTVALNTSKRRMGIISELKGEIAALKAEVERLRYLIDNGLTNTQP